MNKHWQKNNIPYLCEDINKVKNDGVSLMM